MNTKQIFQSVRAGCHTYYAKEIRRWVGLARESRIEGHHRAVYEARMSKAKKLAAACRCMVNGTVRP